MGTYGKRFWDSTNYGRPSGPYSPYTPDELSGWEFEFSGETAGAIARATEALVRFQEQGVVLTDTVNVFFTNRANGSAPSAQTHFHQSRKRAFAASG